MGGRTLTWRTDWTVAGPVEKGWIGQKRPMNVEGKPGSSRSSGYSLWELNAQVHEQTNISGARALEILGELLTMFVGWGTRGVFQGLKCVELLWRLVVSTWNLGMSASACLEGALGRTST